jgi:hypothetical protein
MGEYTYRRMKKQMGIKGNKRTEIVSLATDTDINLKDLVADKIGYSQEYFYLGETEDGKNIYQGYKTTSLIGERIISICGESRDIERTHKHLEKRLNIKLMSFIKSKQYQKTENV